VPVEKVFDLGIGDVFSARVAGNVLDDDLLGSLEFACALAGSKAIVVLGHTACGAVKGALAGAELGHLTGLLARITPAIEDVCGAPTQPGATPDVVDAVVHRNVERVVEQVRTQSEVLRDLESRAEIRIVGAVYDISSGVVEFL
jgi:carbonic anhydrase